MDLDTGDINGDLSKTKCADILQMIELTKKTGLLEIQVPQEGKGTIFFRDGSAVHATFMDYEGIDAARLTAVGYGEDRPIASNNTRAGRTQNRRVEINLIKE